MFLMVQQKKKIPAKNKPAEYTDLCISCHLVVPILLGRWMSLAARVLVLDCKSGHLQYSALMALHLILITSNKACRPLKNN